MYLKTTLFALVGTMCLQTLGSAQFLETDPQSDCTLWHYQPDANANGLIATYDLMELLAIFGQEYEAPDVVPAATVESLTAQVELLSQVVALQSNQLQMVHAVLAGMEQAWRSSPFVWDPEREAWVCEESVLVQGGLSSGVVYTNRLEAGSAQMGGLRVH